MTSKASLQAIGVCSASHRSKDYAPKLKHESPSRIIQLDVSLLGEATADSAPTATSTHRLQTLIFHLLEAKARPALLEEWSLYTRKSALAAPNESKELEHFLLRQLYEALKGQDSFEEQASCASPPSLPLEKISYTLEKPPKVEAQTGASEKEVRELRLAMALLNKQVEEYQRQLREKSEVESQLHKDSRLKENCLEEGERMSQLRVRHQLQAKNENKALIIERLSSELEKAKEEALALGEEKAALEEENGRLRGGWEQAKRHERFAGLWELATEEALGWRQRAAEEKAEREKCERKVKLLKDKNRQLLTYFNISNACSAEQEEEKHNLERIIREFREWLKVMAVAKVVDPHGPLVSAESLDYRVLRPNFYAFLESYEQLILAEKNVVGVQPLDYHFFAHVRLAFDAMFLHLASAQSFRDYLAFPDFLIGFLDRFELDAASGRLRLRPAQADSATKLTFFMCLFNSLLASTWECEIFRDALLERLSLDELYFFLESRHFLGSTVTATESFGAVDPVIFVRLSVALEVVGHQLAGHDAQVVQRVQSLVRSRRKAKHGEWVVDKAFVEKILLEVYLLERPKAERIFESSLQAGSRQSPIAFAEYQHFMRKNFAFLRQCDIAALFRETVALASGKVTARAAHFVCSSRGLFIPLLLQKRASLARVERPCDGPGLLLLQNSLSKAAQFLVNFGVEDLLDTEVALNSFFRQTSFYSGHCSSFLFTSLAHLGRVHKVQTFLQLRGSMLAGRALREDEVSDELKAIQAGMAKVDKWCAVLQQRSTAEEAALKKLSRNFRLRIEASLKEFKRMDPEELKKFKEHVLRRVSMI